MPNSGEAPVILWLASWYPCRLDPYNGDFIQRSAKALSKLYPVQVFYIMKDEAGIITQSHLIETEVSGLLSETRLYYHPPKTGLKVIDRMLSAWIYTRLGRKWLLDFRKKQNPNRPWIVEVGVAMRAGTLALWMKRKWKQSYLVQEHWTGYYRHLMPPALQKGPLFWRMTQRILQNADALLPDSRHLGEWINKTLQQIPFMEIPNTVDTDVFTFNPDLTPKDCFRFIHVSTLGYHKNTDGIIRSFKRLVSKPGNLRIELLVVGPGFEPHQAVTQSDPEMNDKVKFSGPTTYREVAALMQTSHALVLFSRFENLPCVMLEAFCCGLPVIATRVGGIAYHLPETHGLMVDSENEDQLLDAMLQLIHTYESYNRAYIAREAAGQYSMRAIAELYHQAYTGFYPQII